MTLNNKRLTLLCHSGDAANRQAVAASLSCHNSDELARTHDESRTHAKRLIRCAINCAAFLKGLGLMAKGRTARNQSFILHEIYLSANTCEDI